MQAIFNEPRREHRGSGTGWFLFALIVSLGLHIGFLIYSKGYRVPGLTESSAPILLPPKFVVKQVTVDAKNLLDAQETSKPQEKPAPKVEALVFSDGKPQATSVEIAQKPVEAPKQLLEEKPQATKALKEMDLSKKSGAAGLDEALREIGGGFLQSTAISKAQPVLIAGKGDGSGKAGDMAIPGRTSIEEALRDMSVVPKLDVPVAIPGNTLFDYDSVELTSKSIPKLDGIAELRRRFPEYTMVIIGYTDSFGTQEYNQRLSLRRAEAVRDWLIKKGFDANKLEAVGMGAKELTVDSSKTVEEQAPNRRVEVILKPPTHSSKPAKKAL